MKKNNWKKGRFYNWSKKTKDGKIINLSFAEIYPEKYWHLTISSYGNTFITKKFKTKSQALRFAKLYMRKH